MANYPDKTHIPSGNEQANNNLIFSILSYLVAFPIFILLHNLLPNPDWKFNIDRILLFVVTVAIIKAILQILKPLTLFCLVCSLAWLAYGSFTDRYGFRSLYNDYRAMIYSIANTPRTANSIISNAVDFPHKKEIHEAVDYDNREVRNFSLLAVRQYFSDEQENSRYRTIVQCFSIFKKINTNWKYVSDPKSREYFAKASESINTLAGDCDDHSIMMAACIKSIGGTARLVHTTGHIYPELLIGSEKDLEAINYVIKQKLFQLESDGKRIAYHTDSHGDIWLNLDYTDKYPGSHFMHNEILSVLKLE